MQIPTKHVLTSPIIQYTLEPCPKHLIHCIQNPKHQSDQITNRTGIARPQTCSQYTPEQLSTNTRETHNPQTPNHSVHPETASLGPQASRSPTFEEATSTSIDPPKQPSAPSLAPKQEPGAALTQKPKEHAGQYSREAGAHRASPLSPRCELYRSLSLSLGLACRCAITGTAACVWPGLSSSSRTAPVVESSREQQSPSPISH